MKIGVIGTGSIGRTLVLRLSSAGHEVKAANSRGPETIDKAMLVNGAKAATSADAVKGSDVVITSTPPWAIPKLAPLFKDAPEDLVIIDTSNYYPGRDDRIQAVEEGQVESEWVSQQLGRPIVKAWNAIYSVTLDQDAKPKGEEGRIAIPVAADRDPDWKIAEQLVDETGFDAVYSGKIAESWRQQSGNPVYCSKLTKEQVKLALERADRAAAPKNRDESVKWVMALIKEKGRMPTSDESANYARERFDIKM